MMNQNIHVQQIHAVQMLFVQNEMVRVHVNVCRNTLVIRIADVDQNV